MMTNPNLNLLTDAYVFEKIKEGSATRLDLTQSTCGYDPLNNKTRSPKGGNFLYLGKDTHSKGKNRAGYAISRGTHISGLYLPNIGSPFGFGDMVGTNDAILLDLSQLTIVDGKPAQGSTLTIYIARGLATDSQGICYLACDGELDGNIAALRERLQDTTNTTL